jgi:hypothetical protein
MYVSGTVKLFIPKFRGKQPCMQHAIGHLLERLVLPLMIWIYEWKKIIQKYIKLTKRYNEQ